jgi:hypothetical protein
MAPILPVMKLAEVALKQIAKPVSKQLLEGALSYPQVTKLCVSIGQMLHYVNVRVTRSAEGQSSSRRIFELPEDKAKDAGALFLGEVIVFSMTGVIVGWQIWVSQKSSQEQALREEQYEQLRAAEKHAEIMARDARLSLLEDNIHSMWKVLEKIQSAQVYVRAPVEESSTYVPPPASSLIQMDPDAPAQPKPIPKDPLSDLLSTSMSTPYNIA